VVALGLREAGRLVAAVRLRVLGDGLLELGRLAVAPLVHLTKILVPRDPSHPGWTPGWSIVAELVRCMRGGPGRGGRPW
jgi:hypothetical protein